MRLLEECFSICMFPCVCAESIDHALSLAARSQVMDDAAESFMNSVTSYSPTHRTGSSSDSKQHLRALGQEAPI